ncbi:serine hydrolase domain-containing protein [soil metagenome]
MIKSNPLILPVAGLACLAGLVAATVTPARADDALDPAALQALDATVLEAIAAERFAGAVIQVQRGNDAYGKAYGERSVDPKGKPMLPDTIFDVASLTKVVATAPSIMVLVDRELLDPDEPVARYLPEFVGDGREKVTVAQLLIHTSGLPPILPRTDPPWEGHETGIGLGLASALRTEPGAEFRYSDVNFILLGEIVRRVSGHRLDAFSRAALFEPLGMSDTRFRPPRRLRGRIAPTERTARTGLIHGQVHDPAARAMEGVAGHAGLFSTVPDLGRFCAMMVNKGTLEGTRVLSEKAVQSMTRNQMPRRFGLRRSDLRRGYGWDIESPFSSPRSELFSADSFGHTGWTGGALWIDPAIPGFAILMANRNHPTERKNIKDVRADVFTHAAEAMGRGD